MREWEPSNVGHRVDGRLRSEINVRWRGGLREDGGDEGDVSVRRWGSSGGSAPRAHLVS